MKTLRLKTTSLQRVPINTNFPPKNTSSLYHVTTCHLAVVASVTLDFTVGDIQGSCFFFFMTRARPLRKLRVLRMLHR